MNRLVASVLLAASFLLSSSPGVRAESVTVTTLEWPPYTSASLPQGGATSAVVREAFAKAELETEVQVLPWKRAIAMAKNGESAIAYYPGYHCRHVEGFVASEPIGNGPLGFAENVDAAITWQSIDDIGEQKLKIGTVLGYANTEEFDEKAGTGWIHVIPAKDDVTNLKKLQRKRLDAAVIDKLVLAYLMATESSLAEAGGELRFDERPLEEKTLFLCFVDDEKGRAMRDRFNAGLAGIDVQKVIDDYFVEQF